MVGHDDFGDGGHTHGVAAYDAEVLILGGSLERRACGADIYAVHDAYVFLQGYLVCLLDKLVAVSLCHGRETRSEFLEVPASQRVLREEVDLVSDNHDVAHTELLVHAAGGVADKEGIDAERLHYAHGESHLLHVVTLIVVESALHGHDVLAAKVTEDEFAGMSCHRRYGEVGYLFVGKLCHYIHVVNEIAETGTEDYSDFGHLFHPALDIVFCLLD